MKTKHTPTPFSISELRRMDLTPDERKLLEWAISGHEDMRADEEANPDLLDGEEPIGLLDDMLYRLTDQLLGMEPTGFMVGTMQPNPEIASWRADMKTGAGLVRKMQALAKARGEA